MRLPSHCIRRAAVISPELSEGALTTCGCQRTPGGLCSGCSRPAPGVIGGSLGSLCLASTARTNALVVLWPGPIADPRRRFLPDGCVQGSRDVVDRRLLGLADFLTVLPVSSCDFVGQRDDEPAIFVDLCRRGLALKQSDRIVGREDERGLGQVAPVPIPLRSDVPTIRRCEFQTASDREPGGGATRL